MKTRTLRKVVKINEDLCNGCGVCITSCAEGALKIIDCKAKLISEKYCDGLGNCLKCPQDAITIEEREAEDFDEEAAASNQAVKEHLETPAPPAHPAGCPGSALRQFNRPASKPAAAPAAVEQESGPVVESLLTHWPVQLTLVPPAAPFLKDADVILAAHCVPFADANFHREFLGENKALLIACPKLDDFEAHQEKLNQILKQSGIKSLTVVHMEVPCCSDLVHMAKQAMLASGNIVPLLDVTISIKGERIEG
jgi:NAD-dependent dihydropyrimidine dehydrogenase PreA subunit